LTFIFRQTKSKEGIDDVVNVSKAATVKFLDHVDCIPIFNSQLFKCHGFVGWLGYIFAEEQQFLLDHWNALIFFNQKREFFHRERL